MPTPCCAAAMEEGTPPRRAELGGMKVKALKRRAKEVGVDEAQLDDADDADDVKGTVIALILAKLEPEPSPADVRLQALREELGAITSVKALKKRAKGDGVDESKLEDADDADDVRGAVIELIVEKARDCTLQLSSAKPHFSADGGSGGRVDPSKPALKDRFQRLFGTQHCMFSYNWAAQEHVKAVREQVRQAGVPTWMDIDGGMKVCL